jgi:Xaa-Pro aminopeptidase
MPGQTESQTAQRLPADASALGQLRRHLVETGLDACLIPSADAHHAEWLMPEGRRLSALTGFKGSAGTAIVTLDRLILVTDGRYTDVAPLQIKARPLDVVNVRDESLEMVVSRVASPGFRLGYDPWLHTVADIDTLSIAAARGEFQLVPTDQNPVDAILSVGSPSPGRAYSHADTFAGKSSSEKRRDLARTLAATCANSVLLSSPESVCWLLNIRGSDNEDTPLVYAFALAHEDASVDLFIEPGKVGPELDLGPDVRVRPYDALCGVLQRQAPGRTLAIDPASTSQVLASIATDAGWNIQKVADPCLLPKAIKTDAEISGARACHRREGALLCTFWSWLEAEAVKRPVHESEIAREIDQYRARDSLFQSRSFETIPATGPHGALPHYHVSEETDRALLNGEFLLLDSGGQYRDGTTDVTRTFCLGAPSDEMRARYTLVLRAFIRACSVRFPPLTRGIQIDAIARDMFWREGLDFDHSLGHGVGSFLGVHEGPNRLRPNLTGLEPLRAGMITSIEPAFYAPGRYGVRIENLAVIADAARQTEEGGRMLCFEQLTLCPIDLRPALLEQLTKEEKDWLNDYHAIVRTELSPLLRGEVLGWLHIRTMPIF